MSERTKFNSFLTVLLDVTHFLCTDPVDGGKEAARDAGDFTPEDQRGAECCRVGAQHPQAAARQQRSTSLPELPLHTHYQRLVQTHTYRQKYVIHTCTHINI